MLRLVPFCGRLASRRCCPQSAIGHKVSTQSTRNYWPERRRSELWDPFADMERSMGRMWREMERMSPFGSLRHRLLDPYRTVPIETTEDGQRLYKIALDLGHDFRPEDINVTVKDRSVTVKARRESEENGCKQLREFSYQYSLPEDVNLENVKSLLTSDGLLTIEAPLPPPKEPKATEIPINKSSETPKIEK